MSLSDNFFSFRANAVPHLVSIPSPYPYADSDDGVFRGGVLVLGGKKLLLFELAGWEARAKQRRKRRRLEEKKESSDPNEAAKAREKEAEREAKRCKPKATIDITAYVNISFLRCDLSLS